MVSRLQRERQRIIDEQNDEKLLQTPVTNADKQNLMSPSKRSVSSIVTVTTIRSSIKQSSSKRCISARVNRISNSTGHKK